MEGNEQEGYGRWTQRGSVRRRLRETPRDRGPRLSPFSGKTHSSTGNFWYAPGEQERRSTLTEFRGNRTCLPMDSGVFSCPMSACSPTRFALLPHRLQMKTIRARFNTKFPARLKSEPASRVSLRRPHLTCRFTPRGERGRLKLDGIFVVRESAGLRSHMR